MKKINVYIVSTWAHCSQVVSGFLMLSQNSGGGYHVELNKSTEVKKFNPQNMAIVLAEYGGKKLVYDLMDGYQNIDEISRLLKECDYYFKRSYSSEQNKMILCQDELHKMYPLGMNYMVTCEGNPYAYEKTLKRRILSLRGDKADSYFTCDKFECPIIYKEKEFLITFFTRLWQEDEFEKINLTRIQIIKELKKQYGEKFLGGIRDSKIARQLAPDLIVSKRYTERSRYLNRLKKTDICVGTTGLYDSIGWKTAEYVALGKAIVCEPLKYAVPGEFSVERNYLEFSTSEECIGAIQKLIMNPNFVYQMKLNNLLYYYQYLKPDMIIKRTLDIVDGK